MSLFDRIAQTLDNWLSPASVHPAEDEREHMALLKQSSEQSRAAVEAIRKGNLVATSSAVVDGDVNTMLRYEKWRDTVSPSRDHAAALTRTGHGISFAEQLHAPFHSSGHSR